MPFGEYGDYSYKASSYDTSLFNSNQSYDANDGLTDWQRKHGKGATIHDVAAAAASSSGCGVNF